MKHTLIITVDEVIEALGGIATVAEMTGQVAQNVYNWRTARQFPSRFYVIMQEWLAARGMAAPPSLWGMVDVHTVKRRQRAMAARARARADG